MKRIIVDEELEAKLKGLTQILNLCNAEGRVVARVFPVSDPALVVDARPLLSREEREKRKQENSST